MGRMQIFVQGEGAREIRVVELPSNATVRELVVAAQAQGVTVADGSHAPQHGNGRHSAGADGGPGRQTTANSSVRSTTSTRSMNRIESRKARSASASPGSVCSQTASSVVTR